MKPNRAGCCFKSLLIVFLSMLAWTGDSATFVWTNAAGGNWSNPLGWDLGHQPGPGDIAKITTVGNYVVTEDEVTTVAGIIVGNSTPVTGSQHLLVGAGAILTATAPITINDNGTFVVANGGSVYLGNGAPLHLLGPGTNFGIIIQTNNNIYLYNDGTATSQGGLVNASGALIALSGSGGIVSALRPNDYFQNHGQVVKIAGTGNSLLAASVSLLGGAYTAAAGTVIQFGGGAAPAPLQADPSLALLGLGQFQFTSGFLLFPTNVIPSLDLEGGLLQLGPGFQGGAITNLLLDGINLTNTLPVTGSLTMSNGLVTGMFTVANKGLVNVFGTTFDTPVTVGSGGKFVVSSSANIGNGSISNVWLTIASGGDLEAGGLLTVYGPLTNSGTLNVTNGTSIQTFNNGTPGQAGGVMNKPTGVIGLWNNSSLYGLARGNEYLINQGAINQMSGTAQSTIDVNFFTNSGSLSARHGTLLVQSTHGSLQSSETLGVILNSATDYGKFSIPGAATLNGSLAVSLGNGYVPPAGATFSVVSYGSLANGFSSFNYPTLLFPAAWQPAYSSTALTLQFQSGFIPVSPGTNWAIRVNGLPGHQAILMTATNMALPLGNWTPLSTNTFDITGYLSFTNKLIRTEPRRFFGFKLP